MRKYAGQQQVEWPAVDYAPMPGMATVHIPAMTAALGLEPTPEAYIGHLVLCFREVRRVMREDGVLWCVMGDSYAAQPGQRKDTDKAGPKQNTNAGAVACPSRHSDDLQAGDLMLVPARLALALQADGWIVRNDVVWAKCLSGGAMVYAKTQKGEMPMTVKDMVRLDPATVQLWDGQKWNQCIEFEEQAPHPDRKQLSLDRRQHKYQTGEELPVLGDIEIELRNGERIGCTRDHRWPIEGLGMLIRAEDLQPGYVLKATTLPEPEQPRMPIGLDDEEIGWFVGMYIAEGHTWKGKIGISSHIKETERESRLIALAEKYDGYSWTHQSSKNGMVIFIESPVLMGILQTYVSGKLAQGKHLHARCWKRSNRFLGAVLKGYLEGDGHWDGKRWRLGFCKNDSLAADLRTMASRLGCSLRLRRTQHTMGDRRFPGWLGSVAFDGSYRKQPDTQIVAIRQSRARKFWNIALAEEPHLYALSCGVLTCNSSPMPESVSGWRWERCRVKVGADKGAGKQPTNPGSLTAQNGGIDIAHWSPCPGCAKCEATGGYVLRRGSWRHTRAHETVIMAVKAMGYYADQERVREKLTEASIQRMDQPTFHQQTGGPKDYGSGSNRSARKMLENLEQSRNGRNPRSVLTPAPESYSGDHYAVYPRTLIAPLLRATAPPRVCPACGAPWAPVVEREKTTIPVDERHGRVGHVGQPPQQSGWFWQEPNSQILGHRPTCDCPDHDPAPGWVLDPFVGSGTSLAVCRELGVNCVGLDISARYLDDHAKVRISLTPSGALEDLPLFERLQEPAP